MKVRWIVVCVVFVLAAVLPFGLKLWIDAAEPRRWKAMEEQLAALVREARARETARPVLRGTPLPGNAWDDYGSDVLQIKPITVGPCWDYLQGYPKADRAKAEAILALHAPALPVFRRGTTRTDADRRRDWEQPRTISSYPCFTLAVCHARFLIEAGKLREGAEWLLDAGQFGLDFARNGDVVDAAVGLNHLNHVHNELRRLLSSPGLSPGDLLEIDRELGVLEVNFPRMAENYANDSLESGYVFLRTGSVRGVMDQYGITKYDIPTWQHGFSERIMMAGAFDEMRSVGRRQAAAQSKPWVEVREIHRTLTLEQTKSGNPLVRQLGTPLGDHDPHAHHREFVREYLAHHRMIRTAIRFLAGGDVPPQEDPFGGQLMTFREGNRLKVWSVGGDGVDDLGVGDWKPARFKDIVLEVERR